MQKNQPQLRLIERIRSGDADAEKELFHKYKDAIHWKVCRHIKTNVEDMQDVVSDICVAILEGLRNDRFEPTRWASLDAYVWGVANNKIRDWFKRSRRDKNVFHNNPLKDDVAVFTEKYLLENEELRKQLQLLLNILPSKYKEVLDLRYFEDLSVAEISQRIGLPPRRVSERIHYALKLLRKACKKNVFNI